MADNPFQSGLGTNSARQAGLWDMRMMGSADRADMQGTRRSYGGARSNPMLSGMMGLANDPDLSQFTYDPIMRQRAIEAGVQPLEADQVRQNAFLPSTGFFGNHPRLSAALESGLFSMAASHGGNTPGESIQGVIQGLIGGQQMRRGMISQQFARPFEAASIMEGLEDRKQRRDLQAAQIKHYESEADIQADRVQMQREKNEMTRWGVTPVEGGSYITEPGKAPVFQAGPGRGKGLEGDLDIGTREQLRIANVDPSTATSAQISSANKAAQQQAVTRAGAFAGAGASARLPYQNFQDARTQHGKRITELSTKLLKTDNRDNLQIAKDQYYDELTSRIQEARENGQQAPQFKMPSLQDIHSFVEAKNSAIQSQIDAENAAFSNQWPQAMEAPPVKGGKQAAPKAAAPKIPTFNPTTGKLE